jgi:hypothetical protein
MWMSKAFDLELLRLTFFKYFKSLTAAKELYFPVSKIHPEYVIPGPVIHFFVHFQKPEAEWLKSS